MNTDGEQPDSFFRQEALEFSAGQRGPGELVRISRTWTDCFYWLLLALVVAAAVASIVVRFENEPLLLLLIPVLKTFLEHS